ncbi:MAG: NosD domain-containing protein [Candidatus Bathyarchaeia archaeon]
MRKAIIVLTILVVGLFTSMLVEVQTANAQYTQNGAGYPLVSDISISPCDNLLPVNAQSSQTITINANGEIMPSNVALKRDGNTYTITVDLSSSIIVEANNVIIDGANHTLQGPSINENSIALNLTAANVTVENMHITNWKTGILGAWNNNTIANNEFSNNYEGIVIYGDDYVVRQNSLSNSTTGLFIDGGAFRPQGDNNLITKNQITDNNEAFDITNSNGTTITANNIANNSIILVLATNTWHSTLYYNNFTNNKQVLDIPFGGPTVEGIIPFSPAGQWDNGTVGNYWSDYITRYPNATEIDHTGIGNTPYTIASTISYSEDYGNGTDITGIAVIGTATDNYPLMAPTSTSTSTLIQSSPTATPSVPKSSILIILITLLVTVCLVVLLSLRHQAKTKYKSWH